MPQKEMIFYCSDDIMIFQQWTKLYVTTCMMMTIRIIIIIISDAVHLFPFLFISSNRFNCSWFVLSTNLLRCIPLTFSQTFAALELPFEFWLIPHYKCAMITLNHNKLEQINGTSIHGSVTLMILRKIETSTTDKNSWTLVINDFEFILLVYLFWPDPNDRIQRWMLDVDYYHYYYY